MNKIMSITKHARNRQVTRNLHDEDVLFVLQHGQRIRSGGVLPKFLGRRNIPANKAMHRRFARLEGTVLMLDDTGDAWVLVTVYRNRRGAKALRTKSASKTVRGATSSLYGSSVRNGSSPHDEEQAWWSS